MSQEKIVRQRSNNWNWILNDRAERTQEDDDVSNAQPSSLSHCPAAPPHFAKWLVVASPPPKCIFGKTIFNQVHTSFAFGNCNAQHTDTHTHPASSPFTHRHTRTTPNRMLWAWSIERPFYTANKPRSNSSGQRPFKNNKHLPSHKCDCLSQSLSVCVCVCGCVLYLVFIRSGEKWN